MTPTRGERNNNPGNIERGKDKWKGLAADQSGDSRFCVFTDPRYGIRAIGRIMLSYSHACRPGTDNQIDTVQEIIDKWAPSAENNTAAYVEAVADELGCPAGQMIDVTDQGIMFMLVTAIIRHENGRVIYTNDQLREGVAWALA